MLAEESGWDVKTCMEIPDSDRLNLVGCTPFVYCDELQRLTMGPQDAFDPEWIKMTCVRSGWGAAQHDVDEIWLNRHGDAALTTVPGFFPRNVDSLFPQIVHNDSRLFCLPSTGNAARFMGRFHANNVFAAQHTRATSLDGDFVTLFGEFTEYLATAKNYYKLPLP